MNELLFFLPGIFGLGLITSYQDIKIGKIRNKWVIISLIYAFIMYAILIIYTALTSQINIHYLIELVTNFVFSIFIGFGLWYYNIWSAGDGKLYIAYSALIPLSTYSLGYQEWIPGITLLINTFLLGLIAMMFLLIKQLRIKELKKAVTELLKDLFEPKKTLQNIINLFALYWLIQLLLSFVGLGNVFFIRLLLTILIFSKLQKKMGEKMIIISLLITILRFSIDKEIYSLKFLINFLLIVFVWKIIGGFSRGIIPKIGGEVFSKTIKAQQLIPGMILNESIEELKELSKKEKSKLLNKGVEIIKKENKYYIKTPFIFQISQKSFLEQEAEGLTKKQINTLTKLGFSKYRISKTIPFAPIMFIGTIITILVKGNFLILIKNLIF